MQVLKIIFYLFAATFIVGCTAASGPIKAYGKNVTVDKESLSIIYLPPDIELLEVDGMEIDTPFIEEGHNEVHIPPGMHQVAVKYAANWGDATSGGMVKSAPVVLGVNIAPKSSYYIKFNKPKDQWQAEHLANSFAPWMENASGKKLKIVKNLRGGNKLTSGNKSMTGQPSMSGKAPLEKLKFWWKKASFKEKKAFESWMGGN